MKGLWHQNEGYAEDGPYIILSGGDMWTGPAISTWFKGESMAEVMNAMDYSAAAIGNHEFDFKAQGLVDRLEKSNFPFLGANIREKSTGEIPTFARPYILKEINNIKIGILGLASKSTPTSTAPINVKDYNFIDYETALKEYVPEVKSAGAELLILISHLCRSEMQELAPIAAEMGISVIGGGHCHERVCERLNKVTIVEAGSNLKNYAKIDILFDTLADTIKQISQSLVENVGGTQDEKISAIVSYWKTQIDTALSEVIGYVGQEIPQRSSTMYNLITDSWLIEYPSANISITNKGGIRQSIPSGNITLATIVGVLPFDNNLVEVKLTGAQLPECLHGGLVKGGMTTIDGYKLLDGTEIFPDSTYIVLTTDYLYSRPDHKFQQFDHNPYDTSINYRQPVIDWIKSLNTSTANPLDQHLNDMPR